jgi:hypothetical protein
MNPIFGNERNDKNNAFTRFLIERDEMGTRGVPQKPHLFMFNYTDESGKSQTMTATGYDQWDARKGLPSGVEVKSIKKII